MAVQGTSHLSALPLVKTQKHRMALWQFLWRNSERDQDGDVPVSWRKWEIRSCRIPRKRALNTVKEVRCAENNYRFISSPDWKVKLTIANTWCLLYPLSASCSFCHLLTITFQSSPKLLCLGRNVHWMIFYKVYVLYLRSEIHDIDPRGPKVPKLKEVFLYSTGRDMVR